MAIRRRVGEIHKQRAHQRHAVMRSMLDSGVQVGHQAVALFDVPAAYRFLLWPIHPHLMASRAIGRMIAIDRLKGRDFQPLRQQVCGRGSGKAAHVGSGHRKAAQSEVQQLRCCHAHMVPRRAVITGPRHRIALAACEARACHYKGPLVRPACEHTVAGGFRVQHAVHVMDLAMIRHTFSETRHVDAMLHIIRHGLCRRVEDCGLVHVV